MADDELEQVDKSWLQSEIVTDGRFRRFEKLASRSCSKKVARVVEGKAETTRNRESQYDLLLHYTSWLFLDLLTLLADNRSSLRAPRSSTRSSTPKPQIA